MEELVAPRVSATIGPGCRIRSAWRRAKGHSSTHFPSSVIFLCVAAFYESWTIPFVNLLMLPLGVLGALAATSLRGSVERRLLPDRIPDHARSFDQERDPHHSVHQGAQRQGKGMVDATLPAVKIRFRPVIMTSLAFFFGTLPLATATGAGAGAMNAIGTAVTGGMLSATFIDLIFIPLFFVVVCTIFSRKRGSLVPQPAPIAALLAEVETTRAIDDCRGLEMGGRVSIARIPAI